MVHQEEEIIPIFGVCTLFACIRSQPKVGQKYMQTASIKNETTNAYEISSNFELNKFDWV